MSSPVVRNAAGAAPLTQAERTALSEGAMIEAAKELLLERGIEKTTLAAIGERAGYSRGLASYRYGTKAKLFDAVCRSIARNWIDFLAGRVGEQTGTDAMCTALDSFFDFVTGHPKDAEVLQILYGAAASPDAEYRRTSADIHRRQLEDVAQWVRAGIAEGSIRPELDADSVAAQYIAYISGMTYLWLISQQTVDFRKANEDMKAQLASWLRANPTPARTDP